MIEEEKVEEDNSFINDLRETSQTSRSALEFKALTKAKKLMQDAARKGLNTLSIYYADFEYPNQLGYLSHELKKLGVSVGIQRSASHDGIDYLALKW